MIGRVKGIPPKTTNMPILKHFHLITRGGNLILIATDLDLVLKVEGKAEVFDEGDIAVPADPLLGIIKNMPDEQVSFEETDRHRLKIASGSARFEILGLRGKEFPQFPEVTFDRRFSMQPRMAVSMLEKTMFAAIRKENGMPHLSGVLLQIMGDNGKRSISMVATDGHRLARVQIPSGNVIPELPKGIIIPFKGCIELLRMMKETDDDIEFGINENSLLAGMGNESLIIRLGELPLSKLQGSFAGWGKTP